ncbi:MAG: T9SS C-terminal target domain-containing protein, partial [Stygiobacter sp.]
SGSVPTTSIYVRFAPTTVQSYSAIYIAHSCGAATPQYVELSGNGISATTPTIVLSKTALSFGNQQINTTSSSQYYTVSGNNLTSNITITSPSGFQISQDNISWQTTPITLYPSSGAVQNTSIYVRFGPTSATSYGGNISNASNGATLQNVSVSGTGIPPSTSHFITVWSGTPFQAMTIWLESATYTGSQLSNEDEVAVFDGNLCVGFTKLNGPVSTYVEIKVSADNPLTAEVDGFTDGHEITYKLWKASSSTEVSSVTKTYNPASPVPTFSNMGTAYVNLVFGSDPNQTQNIQIPAKTWFIFSLYLNPASNSMQTLLQGILSTLVKVQDEDGNSIVKFPNGTWNYGISNWSSTEGYYIYVNNAVSLTVTGIPITLPLIIPLPANKWNIISYPSQSQQDALAYFNSLTSSNKLKKVQDYAGNSIVKFPNGAWNNSIGNLKPNEGYYVYLSSDGSISASQAMNKQILTSTSHEDLIYYKQRVYKQKYLPMNIFFIDVDENIKELAAYNTNGLLVGAGKVLESSEQSSRYAELIVSSDDPETQNIDGFSDNENIIFKAWDGNRERLLCLSVVGDGRIVFEKMGTLFLRINEDSFKGKPQNEFVLLNNYPNPFNPSTVIEFNLSQEEIVSLTIYNSLGAVIDKLIEKETKAAGQYRYNWNAKDLASGIYYYQLKTSNKIFLNKMILMK